MAIDPRLYEKYSGKSSDPYKKLGEALAQSAARKSQRDAAKDMSLYERHLHAKVQSKRLIWGVLAIIGLIALLSGLKR